MGCVVGCVTLGRCSSSAMDARMLPRSLIGEVCLVMSRSVFFCVGSGK